MFLRKETYFLMTTSRTKLTQVSNLPPPGRDLDALVAQIVMGYNVQYHVLEGKAIKLEEGKNVGKFMKIPNYSTNIADAWDIVKKIMSTHFEDVFSLLGPSDESNKWFAGFEKKWHGNKYGSNIDNVYTREGGETAPHAICLAAIKVFEA